jgi:hypothetical protein
LYFLPHSYVENHVCLLCRPKPQNHCRLVLLHLQGSLISLSMSLSLSPSVGLSLSLSLGVFIDHCPYPQTAKTPSNFECREKQTNMVFFSCAAQVCDNGTWFLHHVHHVGSSCWVRGNADCCSSSGISHSIYPCQFHCHENHDNTVWSSSR